MKNKTAKSDTYNKLAVLIGVILIVLCFLISFNSYSDYSVLDMYLFDGYLTEPENGMCYISTEPPIGESRPIQMFDADDLSQFYVAEIGQYRIEPNSKQIIIKKENEIFHKELIEIWDNAPIYILQKDGTYANTVDGTKLTINNGEILNSNMINSKKYYYDSGNKYYEGYDSCLRYKVGFIEKIMCVFKIPLFWLSVIYLFFSIALYMRKKMCLRYMTIIGIKKDVSLDVLMQDFNKGYEKVLKDLTILKNKKYINDYSVDFNKRMVCFNSTMESKDTISANMHSVICPTCGANCKVSSIGNNKCEYCGTVLN